MFVNGRGSARFWESCHGRAEDHWETARVGTGGHGIGNRGHSWLVPGRRYSVLSSGLPDQIKGQTGKVESSSQQPLIVASFVGVVWVVASSRVVERIVVIVHVA